MVICPYSVHITMANFSPIFRNQISSPKCSIGLFHVKEDIKLWFRAFICPKVQYFSAKMYRGYIVAIRQCNHRRIFAVTQILFLQSFRQNSWSLTSRVVQDMLANGCTAKWSVFVPLKYNIFPQKYSMVIYTPVCIYNHGEFFSNIYARKFIAEVLKWLISY